MSEKIENMTVQVARAILMAGEENHLFWDSNYPEADCEILAKAAIAAMRKPTDEMRNKGGEVVDGSGFYIGPIRAALCWQTMIDEASK
jgi:hypothetical protein